MSLLVDVVHVHFEIVAKRVVIYIVVWIARVTACLIRAWKWK